MQVSASPSVPTEYPVTPPPLREPRALRAALPQSRSPSEPPSPPCAAGTGPSGKAAASPRARRPRRRLGAPGSRPRLCPAGPAGGGAGAAAPQGPRTGPHSAAAAAAGRRWRRRREKRAAPARPARPFPAQAAPRLGQEPAPAGRPQVWAGLAGTGGGGGGSGRAGGRLRPRGARGCQGAGKRPARLSSAQLGSGGCGPGPPAASAGARGRARPGDPAAVSAGTSPVCGRDRVVLVLSKIGDFRTAFLSVGWLLCSRGVRSSGCVCLLVRNTGIRKVSEAKILYHLILGCTRESHSSSPWLFKRVLWQGQQTVSCWLDFAKV